MRFFLRRSAFGMKFQYAIVFFQKANKNYTAPQVMEMQDDHLRTSRFRNECSTICVGIWPVGNYEFFMQHVCFWHEVSNAIVFLRKAKNNYGSSGDTRH